MRCGTPVMYGCTLIAITRARLLAFRVEPVELVDAAPQPFLGRMVLQRHHRDVVHLHRVRASKPPGRAPSRCGTAGRRAPSRRRTRCPPRRAVDGVEGLGEPGTFPAARRLAGELADRRDGVADRRALVFEVVHRPLDVAVAHEFPARLSRRLGDARVAAAHRAVDRQGRRDAKSLAAPRRSARSPTRMPYSCQAQFGRSGSSGCP